MAQMMKSAGVQAFGQPLVIEDRPVPEVPDGQVRVKIAASNIPTDGGKSAASCSRHAAGR
jgi:hypothetical protein